MRAGYWHGIRTRPSVARRFERQPPRRIDDELWVCDVDGYDRGLHVRLRMTVARLSDGGLWLYSPVPVDDALAEQLAELGPVRHLVAPSRGHNLFSGDAKQHWPAATLWISPGLEESGLPADETLTDDRDPWPGVLEPLRLAAVPAIDEVAFLHVPTRSLICCDLVINVHDEPNWMARTLYRALGVWRKPGPTRYWRWKTKDAEAARASYERIVAWEPRRVIMAHGDIVEDDATAWLARALNSPARTDDADDGRAPA